MFGLGKLGKLGRVGGVRTTLASILSKYPGSHLWDFGVSADKVAAGASMTPSQFAAAYPAHALFQDTAGTTPAYLITHPVALCKDAVGTAHASQANSLKMPKLSALVNLLTATEDFSNAAWEKQKAGTGALPVATSNYALAPDGTMTAQRVVLNKGAGTTGGDYSYLIQRPTAASGVSHIGRFWVKLTSGTDPVTLQAGDGGTLSNLIVTDQWQFVSNTITTNGTTRGIAIINIGNVGATQSADILVWHPDFRLANSPTSLPAYQRVTTSTDYDLTGFPLRAVWDGVDDCLVVPTLDLSITDKVTVVAGVTKTQSAAGVVSELSSRYDSNAGGFVLVCSTTSKS